MKIAIDAIPLIFEKTGIGNYTRHLVAELLRIAPEHDFYLSDALCYSSFSNLVKIERDLSQGNDLNRALSVPFPFMTVARYLLQLKNKLRKTHIKDNEMDIFLGTSYSGVFSDKFKTVIVVHDMAHMYYPEATEETALVFLREQLPAMAGKAHRIITDSENSKSDIVRFLDVPADKVKAIHLGVSAAYKPISNRACLDAVRLRYRLPEKFLLFVGTIQPRKNLVGLLKALASLKQKPGFKHNLVISGSKGWKSEGLQELINSLGLGAIVHFAGYVDEADLPGLYSLADLFVLPSLYEGFGLPVIEAMACGVPVVTANSSSLAEIATDAAVLVDPHSVEEIAAGIERLLEDQRLREQCIAKGLERAACFTWEKCARETLGVFREMMEVAV